MRTRCSILNYKCFCIILWWWSSLVTNVKTARTSMASCSSHYRYSFNRQVIAENSQCLIFQYYGFCYLPMQIQIDKIVNKRIWCMILGRLNCLTLMFRGRYIAVILKRALEWHFLCNGGPMISYSCHTKFQNPNKE